MIPTPPSAFSVAKNFAGLSLRRLRRGKLLRVVIALLFLPVLSAAIVLITGNAKTEYFERMHEVYLRFIIPLVIALQASSTVAEEVQQKTITYLFSRPIARWTLPIGKYVGLLLLNIGLIGLSITATYLLVMIGEGGVTLELPRLATSLFSTTLAAVYYGALGAAFGAMVVSLPFAVMMAYVLLVDIGASYAPGMLKAFSMGSHLLAVGGRYRPQSGFFSSDPELTLAISVPVLLAVSVLWLVIAVGWVNSTEYRTDQ